MRKIFWDNPYQSLLQTRVASVDNNYVLFEETIVFSFSGGQESDQGYVNGLAIVDSEIDGNLIYYRLPDGHNLKPGDAVTMKIDWPRRYRLMRLHFAAELVLELVTQELKLEKIGAHIAENKARIDFCLDKNISFLFASILRDYNKIIEKDRKIKTGFSDIQTQRRFWEIEGFSRVACGGTHVKSTSEVGLITLKRINIGSGKERIEIKLLDNNWGLN
ncbi:alanyl-tRNA editing protein [Legionella maioricensis]|uniref:Alanyl-tRNA editing protein n=1 Tax=Legionella maioricensis TaxID=2896528 RepID=A0A9X2D3C8_9GAMM|nr:alanyl-tRNA editing protein [Legionella maioricensis]MCL9685681.1 alanyl-tRNA editing protein [Legionella maioricensis]MCL9689097.1 alanyl-tRNA editing protein [Legionella maioricensis]